MINIDNLIEELQNAKPIYNLAEDKAHVDVIVGYEIEPWVRALLIEILETCFFSGEEIR